MAEKIKTLAEKRVEAKESLKNYKFNTTGIRHTKPDVVKFKWQLRTVDLRTASERLIRAVADDPYNGVLEYTKAGEAAKEKASGSESSEETSGKKK